MKTSLSLVKFLAAMVCASLGSGLTAASEVASYDLSRDFSIASNPNGVWSYGWKSTLTGAFNIFTRGIANFFSNGVQYEV